MLYLIIPPILVILSLIGIILFITRKLPAARRLKKTEESQMQENVAKDIFSKDSREKNIKSGKFRQKILIFLEKIALRFKVIFLKLENIFSSLGESIRNKRKKRIERRPISEILNEDGDEILANQADKRETEKNFDIPVKPKEENAIREAKIAEKKKAEMRPFISQKMTMPRSAPERKDLFEKIMIERIAANPKDMEAYERLGEYYIEIENWKDAKECFKQVIKLGPGNFDAKAKMRKLERLLSR